MNASHVDVVDLVFRHLNKMGWEGVKGGCNYNTDDF
jgi:hypothetical protein